MEIKIKRPVTFIIDNNSSEIRSEIYIDRITKKCILFGWIEKNSPNIETFEFLMIPLMLKQFNMYLVINAYTSTHVYVYEI